MCLHLRQCLSLFFFLGGGGRFPRKNGTEISGESFPKVSETVEFPKCEQFNRKF